MFDSRDRSSSRSRSVISRHRLSRSPIVDRRRRSREDMERSRRRALSPLRQEPLPPLHPRPNDRPLFNGRRDRSPPHALDRSRHPPPYPHPHPASLIADFPLKPRLVHPEPRHHQPDVLRVPAGPNTNPIPSPSSASNNGHGRPYSRDRSVRRGEREAEPQRTSPITPSMRAKDVDRELVLPEMPQEHPERQRDDGRGDKGGDVSRRNHEIKRKREESPRQAEEDAQWSGAAESVAAAAAAEAAGAALSKAKAGDGPAQAAGGFVVTRLPPKRRISIMLPLRQKEEPNQTADKQAGRERDDKAAEVHGREEEPASEPTKEASEPVVAQAETTHHHPLPQPPAVQHQEDIHEEPAKAPPLPAGDVDGAGDAVDAYRPVNWTSCALTGHWALLEGGEKLRALLTGRLDDALDDRQKEQLAMAANRRALWVQLVCRNWLVGQGDDAEASESNPPSSRPD